MSGPPRGIRGAAARIVVAVGIVLTGQQGCGYHLVGTGGGTVAVTTFRNATSQYGLEGETSAAFIRALQSSGKVSLADRDRADAWFEGTISGYVNNPISYTAQREVVERRVLVTMAVNFYVRGQDKPFFTEPGMVSRAEYQVTGSVVRDSEQERAAARRAIDDLATRVVSRLVEGF
jgi:hypothetical protein